MNLYVVRHAEALPIGAGISRDSERPLSAQGEHDAALMGRVLSLAEPGILTIATSPLVRARRTADILAAQFVTPPRVIAWQVLEPGFDMHDLLDRVNTHDAAPLILVAHQPDLTEFISWLVADAPAGIAFPPGAVACISRAAKPGGNSTRLQWILTPKLVTTLHPEW